MNRSFAAWLVRAAAGVLLMFAGTVMAHAEAYDRLFGDLAMRLDPFTPTAATIVVAVSLAIRFAVIGLTLPWRLAGVFAVSLVLFLLVTNSPALTGDRSPWAGEAVGWGMLLFVFPISILAMALASVPLFDTKFRRIRLESHPAAGAERPR